MEDQTASREGVGHTSVAWGLRSVADPLVQPKWYHDGMKVLQGRYACMLEAYAMQIYCWTMSWTSLPHVPC